MLQCWKHEPSKRPTFDQLQSILEEAKPEQVQGVTSTVGCGRQGVLEFEVGDVITVLDKQISAVDGGDSFWSGALNNGRIGVFSPTHTVAYLGTLPSQGNHSRWQNEDAYSSFQRNSLRGSLGKSRTKKLSRDMISGPKGDVQVKKFCTLRLFFKNPI